MASANITLTETCATIEVDTTERTATRSPSTLKGYLVNGHASVKVFVNLAAGTVATTDAQAQNIIGITAGSSFALPPNQGAFTYKATAASVLYWIPEGV